MRKLISIFIIILIPICILNLMRFNFYSKHPIYLYDLANNKISINEIEITDLDNAFPNLFFNTIPVETVKSRYYLHFNKLKLAKESSLKANKQNPFLAYPKYFFSRIYIKEEKLDSAQIYINKAYEISPKIEAISVLYKTLNQIKRNQTD